MTKNKREINPKLDEKFVKLLDRLVALLEDHLIIEFAKKGIAQQDIRRILRVDMHRITKLLKFVKKSKKKGE